MASSSFLSKLSYDPEKKMQSNEAANGPAEDSTAKESMKHDSMLFEQIAQDLNNATKITQKLRSNGHPVSIKSQGTAPETERSPVEIITEIWENTLDKTGIGPEQHFFDIGGTSLKAIEVLSQLNEWFNKNLTIVSLFEHSTICSLVNLIEDIPAENTEFSKIIKRAAFRRGRTRRRD